MLGVLDLSEFSHRAAEAYACGSYGESLSSLPFGMVHCYDVGYNDVGCDLVTRYFNPVRVSNVDPFLVHLGDLRA